MSWISTRIPEQRQRRVFAGCLAIAGAAAVVAVLTSRSEDWHPVSLVLALAVFNLASELLGSRHELPGLSPWSVISSAPVVLSMTLLGPAPALAIGVVGLAAAAFRDRTSPVDEAANLANYGIFVVAGALLARWVIDSQSLSPDEAGFVLLIIGLSVLVDATSFMINATHGLLAYGDPIRDQWSREGGRLVGAELPTVLLTAVTAYVYGAVGLGALGLLAVVQLIHQYLGGSLLVSQQRAEALQEQAERLTEVSESRGRLVAQVLQAEESERRRLGEALHDEALQELLFIRQRLPASTEGKEDRTGAAVKRAIDQLRGAIFDLHPAVLDHAGLEAALQEVADRQAERAGFQASVDVEPEACGPHDQLLFVLGREQLTNAAKHAGATDVTLLVARNGRSVVMEVSDNGCGMDAERRRIAVQQGHIGLASSAERVDALGGKLEIDSEPGRGTLVRTTLPVDGG